MVVSCKWRWRRFMGDMSREIILEIPPPTSKKKREKIWKIEKKKQTEGRRGTGPSVYHRQFRSSRGNDVRKREMKRKCQECDIEIIKWVSAHYLTEVSLLPNWTCSTQHSGSSAMSNIVTHTDTCKLSWMLPSTTVLHQRAADIIRLPPIHEY